MNYIKRLEKENKAKDEALEAALAEIEHLRWYLQSEKFHRDTTVQTQDVLNRVHELPGILADGLTG